MNSIRYSALLLSLTAAVAGPALAADPAAGLTRAQVLAELADAQRTGSIIDSESGLPRNEINPQRYPAQQKAAGKTRAQVLAELEQARAKGELFAEDTGMRLNELRPELYPAVARQGQSLTRAQMVAEMQQARAAGQLHIGEGG